MRIRATRIGAGPAGVTHIGDIKTVSDQEGVTLIQSGAWEQIADASPQPEMETTEADPPQENTDARPERKRRWPKE
ncbi:MAG TPA: hypothetical protein PLG59_00625 [bacterium]|nr:hypothetical protein [bacterium]